MVCCSLDSAPYVHFDAPTPCSQILENPYSSNCHAKIFQGRLPHCMRQINSTACIQYVATSKCDLEPSQYAPHATRSIMHNDYGRNANNTPQQLVYVYTPEFFTADQRRRESRIHGRAHLGRELGSTLFGLLGWRF
jgi:hypothetical protein